MRWQVSTADGKRHNMKYPCITVHLPSLPPYFMYPLLQDWLQEPRLNEKRCFQRPRIDTHPCSLKKDNGIGFRLPYEQIARSQPSHAAYPSPCDEAYPSLPQVQLVVHGSLRASNLSIRFAHISAAAHGMFFDMRRILRSSLPTVACSAHHRHASDLSVRIARICMRHMSLLRATCVELLSSHCLQLPAVHIALLNVRRPFSRIARNRLRHTFGGMISSGISVATMPTYWTEGAHRVAHRWEAGGLKRSRSFLHG